MKMEKFISVSEDDIVLFFTVLFSTIFNHQNKAYLIRLETYFLVEIDSDSNYLMICNK